MMSATEILREIYGLPPDERKKIRKNLLENSETNNRDTGNTTQDEFDQMLFNDGLLVNFPVKNEEEDDFAPIKFDGKPISETIIEERR